MIGKRRLFEAWSPISNLSGYIGGGWERSARAPFVDPMAPPPAEALGDEATKRRAEFHKVADTANCRAKRAGNRFQDRIRGAFDGNGLTFAFFVF